MPLLSSLWEWVGDPPVKLGQKGCVSTYRAPIYNAVDSWLLSVHHGILQLLMWWRGQWPLKLAKEASCTAFSSPPPPIRELLHCVCPMARDTAIVTSGGRSFESYNTLATGLFGGEVCSLYIPGWASRGRATATAMAPFGPWPDFSKRLARVIPFIVSSLVAGFAGLQRIGCHHHPQHQKWGHLCHQILALGIAIHQKHICLKLLWLG